MEDDATVSPADIARLAGVGRAAVSNWRRRHPDFPQPVGGTPTSPVFALSEIEEWLRGQGKLREIPLGERAWQVLRAEAGDDLRLAEVVADAGELLARHASATGESGRAAPARPDGPYGIAGTDAPAGIGPAAACDDVARSRSLAGGTEARTAGAPAVGDEARSADGAPRGAVADVVAELAAERGAAGAFAFLFGRYRETHARRASTTPPEVPRLMAELAGDAGTVLDPACGTGDLLAAVVERHARRHRAAGTGIGGVGRDAGDAGRDARAPRTDASAAPGEAAAPGTEPGGTEIPGAALPRLFGQDADRDSARLAAARLALCGGRAAVRAGDSLRRDAFPGVAADAVLCDPPFHERAWGHEELGSDPRWEYGLPPRLEPELAWVQHALAHLAPGGRALVLMPAVAAARRSGRRIRAQLLRRGALRAVFALPSGHHLWLLSRPGGGVPQTVLLVDGADPDTIVATWRAHADDPAHDEPGVSRSVPVIDLLDEEVDLTPARHLSAAGAERSAERFADTQDRLAASIGRLGDLVPFARPSAEPAEPQTVPAAELARIGHLEIHQATARRDADDGGPDPVLTADDVIADRPPSGRGRPDEGRAVRVRAGDVVVAAAGGRLAVRVVASGGALLGPYVTLLRVDPEHLDPHFVAGVLRSSANVRLAAAVPAGTTGRVDVRRARLPRLPLERQRRYGEAFRRMAAFESALRSTAVMGAELAQLLADGVAGGTLAPGSPESPPADR